jgi:hypothetical protein
VAIFDITGISAESEINMKNHEKSRGNLLVWLMIASMLPLLFQINSLENTVGGLKLFWWSVVTGVIVGFGISYFMARRFLSSSERTSLYNLYFFSVWAWTFLTPACASILNRYAPSSAPYKKVFSVSGRCVATGRGGPSYYLLFRTGNSIERVQVSQQFFRSRKSGNQMVFTMRSGFLRFPVIDEVN